MRKYINGEEKGINGEREREEMSAKKHQWREIRYVNGGREVMSMGRGKRYE